MISFPKPPPRPKKNDYWHNKNKTRYLCLRLYFYLGKLRRQHCLRSFSSQRSGHAHCDSSTGWVANLCPAMKDSSGKRGCDSCSVPGASIFQSKCCLSYQTKVHVGSCNFLLAPFPAWAPHSSAWMSGNQKLSPLLYLPAHVFQIDGVPTQASSVWSCPGEFQARCDVSHIGVNKWLQVHTKSSKGTSLLGKWGHKHHLLSLLIQQIFMQHLLVPSLEEPTK